MSSPRKRKKKAAAESEPQSPETPKSRMLSLLSIMPDHPLSKELNDPENKGYVWLVEFANPPGVFMARSVPEPVDMDGINEEIKASITALYRGEPKRQRYTLGMGYSGAHARRLVETITEWVREPEIPFSVRDLEGIEMSFRVVQ